MKPDPPVRADGRCVVCLGPRGVLPKNAISRAPAQVKLELETDPFCSSTCARDWHGNPLETRSIWERDHLRRVSA